MKILFLLKENFNYSSQAICKAGLWNSASFVADALKDYLHHDTKVVLCIDGNDIDREVTLFRPDVCIIEALWVTPEKLKQVAKIHRRVLFITRIHSNVPFLSNEGIAIEWINGYEEIPNVLVAFNNNVTVNDFHQLDYECSYLPNIHESIKEDINGTDLLKRQIKYHFANTFSTTTFRHERGNINIGCFGAIRPLKNHLVQAMAAMAYAEKHRVSLFFHINATRIEQKGESVLKNLRALFQDTPHTLVEHPWYSHEEFIQLISKMDMGMQLSLTESFNIVTADFVFQGIPIIVSPDITWMPSIAKVGPYNTEEIVEKVTAAFRFGQLFADLSSNALNNHNRKSLHVWKRFLQDLFK